MADSFPVPESSRDPERVPARAATGISGLDTILGGGLPRDHAYLVYGEPGCGKTTLCLQFALQGVSQGERVLYLTTSESVAEVREIARSHNWSIDGLEVRYHATGKLLQTESEQSVFHPQEVELPKMIETMLSVVDEIRPDRLVIDSLSEIRALTRDERSYRRQLLALKEYFSARRCTSLVTEQQRAANQPLQSIVHGVIQLEQCPPDYGPERRRLRIQKVRGCVFTSGYHDFNIVTGGIEVYPRLVAAEHRCALETKVCTSGVPELDTLFGGGIQTGEAVLLLGTAGTGKSTVASQYCVTAAERGERSVVYVFDERVETLLARTRGVGIALDSGVEQGLVEIHQVDPAELTPGEFSHMVAEAVTQREARLVIIDSLVGYVHAMPNERLLPVFLHELLSYLSQQGVTVLMVMTLHGLPGTQHQAPFDLSYIADSVLLFNLFEYAGELRKAISVYKRRYGSHETTIRELQFCSDGIRIGQPLQEFHGILTGMPSFTGKVLPNVLGSDQSDNRSADTP